MVVWVNKEYWTCKNIIARKFWGLKTFAYDNQIITEIGELSKDEITTEMVIKMKSAKNHQ